MVKYSVYYLNNKSREAKFVGDNRLFKAFYASNNLCLTSLVTCILSSLLNLTIFSAVKFKSLQQGQWHCLKHLNISMSQARRPGQWHWIVKPWSKSKSKSKPLSQQTPKLNKGPPKKEKRSIWTLGWHYRVFHNNRPWLSRPICSSPVMISLINCPLEVSFLSFYVFLVM